MRKSLGYLGVVLLLTAIGLQAASLRRLAPLIHHRPSNVTFFVLGGCFGFERLPKPHLEALDRDFGPIWNIGDSSPRPRAGGLGGVLLPYELIDTVLAALIGWALLMPMVRAELRARRGLCPLCGYSQCGLEAGNCPECGFDQPKRINRRRAQHWTWPVRLCVVLLAVVFPSLLIGSTANLLADAARIRHAGIWFLQVDPDSFKLGVGQTATIRGDGALGTIRIMQESSWLHAFTGDVRGTVYGFHVCFWANEEDAKAGQPGHCSTLVISEASGPRRIPVGPWQVEWSMADLKHCWLYREPNLYGITIE